MLFNTIQFVIFFCCIFFLYYRTPKQHRYLILLFSSYYFYSCWKLEALYLIMGSTLIDFYLGRKLEEAEEQTQRKKYLYLSVGSNFLVLFIFKYFEFFSPAFKSIFEYWNLNYPLNNVEIFLPLAISFYTLQKISYCVDVYYKKIPAEKHLGHFALFVAFWPQLVAGPIERAGNIIPQLKKHHEFDYQRVTDGLRLMLWGFFKKIVIADRLAAIVNLGYSNTETTPGIILLVSTYFFAFQIYCDFSGYTDIARGSAKIFGIDLMENFRLPYYARTLSEYWKRWHISLSTWFKDYVYIPLGGNRVSKPRWYFNIFMVFFLSGVWHGANWNFLAWGALHGIMMVFAVFTMKERTRLASFFKIDKNPAFLNCWKIFWTFHLLLLGRVFFRATTISDAFNILKSFVFKIPQELSHLFNSFVLGTANATNLFSNFSLVDTGVNKRDFVIGALLILLLETIHFLSRKDTLAIEERIGSFNKFFRRTAYYAALVLIFALGTYGTQEQFIYFHF